MSNVRVRINKCLSKGRIFKLPRNSSVIRISSLITIEYRLGRAFIDYMNSFYSSSQPPFASRRLASSVSYSNASRKYMCLGQQLLCDSSCTYLLHSVDALRARAFSCADNCLCWLVVMMNRKSVWISSYESKLDVINHVFLYPVHASFKRARTPQRTACANTRPMTHVTPFRPRRTRAPHSRQNPGTYPGTVH